MRLEILKKDTILDMLILSLTQSSKNELTRT